MLEFSVPDDCKVQQIMHDEKSVTLDIVRLSQSGCHRQSFV